MIKAYVNRVDHCQCDDVQFCCCQDYIMQGGDPKNYCANKCYF